MGQIIDIGLPPSGSMIRPNWLNRKKAYLNLSVTPYTINAEKYSDSMEAFVNGLPPFDPDFKSMIVRANKLGCSLPEETEVEKLNIYALQEGAITDTYSNNISPETVVGQLSEYISGNRLAKFMRTVSNQFGVDAGQGIGELAKTIGDTFNIESMKNVDPREWSAAYTKLGTSKFKDFLADKAKEYAGFGDKAAQASATLLNTGLSLLSGFRPIYPYLWENSNSSSNYSFRVRLYNPNPCSQRLHQKYIVDYLAILKSLALPSSITKDKEGETENHESTYGPPLYVGVESKGLFRVKYGIIENLTVVYGGDENAIAFNGRPSYIDVTMSIKPLYPIKVIADDLSLQGNPANDYVSMNALQDIDTEETGENGEENGGEVAEEGGNPQAIEADSAQGERGGSPDEIGAYNELMSGSVNPTPVG